MNERKSLPSVTLDKNGLHGSFWRRLRARFGHQCNDLLPSGRILKHLDLEQTRELGVQSVPLDKIVGSSGRYREFDLSFRSRRVTSARWHRIAQARANSVDLPPVALLKVGEAYFVEDGNHRVSVARASGRQTIDARVVEVDASPLQPEPSCERLGYRIEASPQCGCDD